jgi:hypothetical protein
MYIRPIMSETQTGTVKMQKKIRVSEIACHLKSVAVGITLM